MPEKIRLKKLVMRAATGLKPKNLMKDIAKIVRVP